MQEPQHIWLPRLHLSPSDVLHGHQYLIDSGDVLLHLCDVMLHHCEFDALSRPESLHNGSVFVSDVFFDYGLYGFYFVYAVVKTHDLSDELGTLGDQGVMDTTIYEVETGTESFFHGGDAMELGVVGSHDCAVVADQFFTGVTEVTQLLTMQETLALGIWVLLVLVVVHAATWSTAKHHTKGRVEIT